jgi:pyruvate formate lyase activating enzyme
MQIGGLQKNSMIDFPGRISCVLFLSGCNFNCPFCHNPELVRGTPGRVCAHSSESILDFLAHRRTFLDGVVISGGEPTLQPDLLALCRKIREMGFSVKLDTNGSRPRVVQALFEENLIDYVAMDLKTDPPHYSAFFRNGVRLDELLASIQLIMESGVDYEFRTTCVKPWVTPETVRSICSLIHDARRYILQHFRPEGVLQPEYFARRPGRLSFAEMHALKSLAAPYVQECSIRE